MEQFEILPFDETLAWGEVMEGERGRGRPARGGMRSRPRPARARKKPRVRGKPAWPRARGRRTYWTDWPVAVPVALPYEPAPFAPVPYPEPDEPYDAGDEPGAGGEPGTGDDDTAAPDEEIPALLRTVINALPAPRPVYVQVRNLPRAPDDPRTNVPGLYLIVFQRDGRWQAYSGQSGNVRGRLLQHRLCARMLGLPVDAHQVFVAAMPSATPAQRRDVERMIHTRMLAPSMRGLLTNVRREMEGEWSGQEREEEMHYQDTCPTCGKEQEAAFEIMEFSMPGPFSQEQESALAMELLSVASEEELDQFLGKVFKGAWKGLKKAGSALRKVAGPLGGILKGVAKTALPFVGGALGSFIPIPGVGTAVGSMLGRAAASALEAETQGMDEAEAELEMARRFVRIAGAAAQQAAAAGGDPGQAARQAVADALGAHLPRRQRSRARRGAGQRMGRP